MSDEKTICPRISSSTYEADVDGEMTFSSRTGASIERKDTPILVDLTNEESKQVTWKQTVLKQFGEDEESSESGENVVMPKAVVSSRDLSLCNAGGTMPGQLRRY